MSAAVSGCRRRQIARYHQRSRMAAGGEVRILGVALPDVGDWRQPQPAGKWSQFFGALGERGSLVDVVRPHLSTRQEYLNLARSIRPGRAAWLARAGFNRRHLAGLNADLERELLRRAGTYDAIVQLQTLCTPRSTSITTPYAIYTDNTMALTQRHYPPYAPLPGSMLRQWLAFEAEVCRDAEAVFTFSEFARRSVIDDYDCPPDRVLAVGAGANQLSTSPDQNPSRQPRALFVGHDFERKGGRVLLEAWPLVRQAVPTAELVIAGPSRDPAPGLGAGVSWLGRLDRDELAGQYSAASVFVLPSLFEPWGHVFVEAMGYGLPCIGSDCCAMPEIIEDAVTGLLVPPGAAEPLAAALIDLLGDPSKAAGLGRSGQHRVLERFTWTGVADRVLGHLGA